jgi:uncharacterized membrane protein (DUF106 family)
MDCDALFVIYLLVAARLLVPLLIPQHPLGGILVCLLLDSADQSIMQAFGVDSPRYQAYDKALDVYYLSIAYLATMRNWENMAAFQVSRFLFYYRLAGVLAFELTGVRLLLAVFPNSFEPFFVYYESVRRGGDPMRLTRHAMLVVVAVIWLFLKLPHEWWIHIARLDATDFVKTKILGASADTSLWRAIVEAPAVTGALFVLVAVLVLALWRFLERRKRRLDRARAAGETVKGRLAHWVRPVASAGRNEAGAALPRLRERLRIALMRGYAASKPRPAVLIEKIVLVTAVSTIFQQILPGLAANGVRSAVFVAMTIVATDFLLRWVFRHFGVPLWAHVDLAVTAVLNFLTAMVFQLLIPVLAPNYDLESALVFASLITLFVTLYDHYRPVYDIRSVTAVQEEADAADALPAPVR